MGNTTGKLGFSRLWYNDKSPPSKALTTTTATTTVPTEKIKLETFLLVWLDQNIDTSPENKATQNKLRNILTCLVTFDNVESCEQWLKKCTMEEKIVLIVSGAFGEYIVPKIHYLPTIISIYVYCLDVSRNEPWAKKLSAEDV